MSSIAEQLRQITAWLTLWEDAKFYPITQRLEAFADELEASLKWRTSNAVNQRLCAAAREPVAACSNLTNRQRKAGDLWRTVLLSDLQELLQHAGWLRQDERKERLMSNDGLYDLQIALELRAIADNVHEHGLTGSYERLIAAATQLESDTPIDMVLHCPKCHMQHIDNPSEAALADDPDAWDNQPHRSHLCFRCGHTWRPADVPTNGVAAIKTKGKNDS